jgi:hypothetical protein
MHTEMQGQERISKVIAAQQSLVTVEVHTKTFRRFMRRDFNFVTAKMFFKLKKGGKRAEAELVALLHELNDAVKSVVDRADQLSDEIYTNPEPFLFTARVVSPYGAQFLRAIRESDMANRKLMMATFNGVIQPETHRRIISDATFGLWAIKDFLLDRPLSTSIEEASRAMIL